MFDMGAITVRKIDDALKQAMREEAAAKGRSVEAEVRDLLERTYGKSGPGGNGRRPGEGRMEFLLRIAPDMTGFDLPERQPLREPRFP
jgi:antitoxin FitA